MAKLPKHISSENFTNPFLSEDPKELWKKIEQNSKPVSKEELAKRARELKEKAGKTGKQ